MASLGQVLQSIGQVYQYIKNPWSHDHNKDPISDFGKFSETFNKTSNVQEASEILGEVQDTAREQYLEDREHTEEREDTAYQRAVADMRSAGLNPYTIGVSGSASSSASNVGEKSIMSKLQVIGYILDLENLSIKNKQVANQAISNLLRAVSR